MPISIVQLIMVHYRKLDKRFIGKIEQARNPPLFDLINHKPAPDNIVHQASQP